MLNLGVPGLAIDGAAEVNDVKVGSEFGTTTTAHEELAAAHVAFASTAPRFYASMLGRPQVGTPGSGDYDPLTGTGYSPPDLRCDYAGAAQAGSVVNPLIFTVSGARHPLCDSHFKRLLRHQIPSRRSSATLLSQRSSCAMARHVGAQLRSQVDKHNSRLRAAILERELAATATAAAAAATTAAGTAASAHLHPAARRRAREAVSQALL